MGQIYLAQNKIPEAISAFTIEGLLTPDLLTYPIWQEDPYQSLHSEVITRVLEEYDALLSRLPKDTKLYQQAYEQRLALIWWFEKPIPDDLPGWLSPIMQALLLAENNPEQALAILESDTGTKSVSLLAAWFDPQQYLDEFLQASGFNSSMRESIEELVIQEREFRPWLNSLIRPSQSRRVVLAFAYRNFNALDVTLNLPLIQISKPMFVNYADILPKTWPRELPTLDHRVAEIKMQDLNLTPPLLNSFELEPPLPPLE